MATYVLTAFKRNGEKVLDETFTAKNDGQAKEIGTARLVEEGYDNLPHRCATSKAKLILFNN